jgi:hypothetical protein
MAGQNPSCIILDCLPQGRADSSLNFRAEVANAEFLDRVTRAVCKGIYRNQRSV